MTNKKQYGFSLIELVVAMGVFLSLFLIVIVNFRSGESINELKLETQKVASDIRKVQTLAMTGSSYNSQSIGAGGYGIMFLEDDHNYIMFSDEDVDGVYTIAVDISLETMSLASDIDSLQIDSSYDQLHIVFQPYSSNVSIYGAIGINDPVLLSSPTSIRIIHSRVVNRTGIITITPVSGKIDFVIE